MIEAQLVTGATQDMRILTGSALCAAFAAKSAATTLANINLDKRMRSSWWRVWRRLVDFDATLQSGSALGKGRNWRRRGDGLRRAATAKPPQHAPSCFNGKETGHDSRKPGNGSKRHEDCRQARGNHHPHGRRADDGGQPQPSRGDPHRERAH